MTDFDDAEFESLVESAYAEPMMITGAVGDDDLALVAPTPARPGIDLGIAGSLIQTRERLRSERLEELGPPWRDRRSIAAVTVLLCCIFGSDS